jgi:catechol 2,3-dioxygenase-like lactoylglutathione lyase family enzyme
MALQRMDNVSINVEDLDAAIAFFEALGMELEGRAPLEGPIVDGLLGMHGVRTEVAMLRAPGGSSIELTKFHTPAAIPAPTQPNTHGIGRIMFAVDDLNATLARLKPHGAPLIGEIVQYESAYRLCYLRGPENIILALAQELS